MRPSRPTDHAACFTCRRAEFTTFARAPAPPLAPRLAHTGRPCTLPRPA